MLISFVLGASVMWSLESKRPRRQPLWLIIAGQVAFIGIGTFTFVTNEPPRGVITIDPVLWTAMGIFVVAGGVLAMDLQLRQIWSGRAEAP
jgi:hypothetical protein